jgi:peptidoglycan/LPS O-acetylase OafA/YrhL
MIDSAKVGVVASVGGSLAGGRRADKQGMRAIAVLAVFSNHLFDWPSGCFSSTT